MRRIVNVGFPDGTYGLAQPFHMSLEGHETAVLCRDDEDYDSMVKIICTCGWRMNVIIRYPWSGYGAMFNTENIDCYPRVADLSKRRREMIMHTGEDLRRVG